MMALRLTLLRCLTLVVALCAPASAWAQADSGKPEKLWVFLGTYTRGTKSEGIYRSVLDLSTGKLSEPELAAEIVNPSFLAIHPSHKYLYAVTETADFGGKKGKPSGAVGAFTLDPETGKLRPLNKQSSMGAGPCHLVVDKTGKNVLVANYGGGSAAVLPIKKGGELGKATAFVQHKGKSVNPQRQEAPHAHSINVDPANNFAVVADLGLDKVLIYRFDPAKGTITANEPESVSLEAGDGPRHFAFHPNKKFAYVNNELTSSVTALRYDAKTGALQPIHTVTTLPQEVKGNSTAEVVVHPSGQFVYVSNRGHDSIAGFRVDLTTGRLNVAGHARGRFKTPRNFAIDPTGQYAIVAGQSSNTVVVFRINPKSGELTPTGSVIEVPAPVCVRMIPKG